MVFWCNTVTEFYPKNKGVVVSTWHKINLSEILNDMKTIYSEGSPLTRVLTQWMAKGREKAMWWTPLVLYLFVVELWISVHTRTSLCHSKESQSVNHGRRLPTWGREVSSVMLEEGEVQVIGQRHIYLSPPPHSLEAHILITSSVLKVLYPLLMILLLHWDLSLSIHSTQS